MKIQQFLRTCDIFWLGLNGLAVDVAHVTSGAKPRTPLSITGTLKVEPSFIPGVDFRLNKEQGGKNAAQAPVAVLKRMNFPEHDNEHGDNEQGM